MKAIIIEDKDSRALLTSLELKVHIESFSSFNNKLCEKYNISSDDYSDLLKSVHSKFYGIVVR